MAQRRVTLYSIDAGKPRPNVLAQILFALRTYGGLNVGPVIPLCLIHSDHQALGRWLSANGYPLALVRYDFNSCMAAAQDPDAHFYSYALFKHGLRETLKVLYRHHGGGTSEVFRHDCARIDEPVRLRSIEAQSLPLRPQPGRSH